MSSDVLLVLVFLVLPGLIAGIVLAIVLPGRKRRAAAAAARQSAAQANAAAQAPAVQKSLDRIYAERCGQKLCPWCETVNEGGAVICAACGKKIDM